ncbi:hypothetical protein [Flavobacterium sp.]|uniref:hypothetical protein n=1 Tax=Flavobacterium sp. TaxID=239 RepID=UPI004033ABC2
MQYLPETLIAVAILLFLTIYFLAKKPLFPRKRNALLTTFKEVRARSLSLQEALLKHIMDHDALNENLTGTLTYGQVLKQIKKDHITYLSGKKQARILVTNNIFKLNKTQNILKELDSSLTKTERDLNSLKK